MKKMYERKNDIINYIKAHPGCRKRDIAAGIECWVCDLAGVMYELERERLIRAEAYANWANQEFYDKWYAMG